MEQKTRRSLEETSHVKRQRVATEALYYAAANNNIPICTGAVAEPRRLTMDMGHGMRQGFWVYQIPSSDRTSLLTFDMVTGEVHIFPYDADKQMTELPVVQRMPLANPETNCALFDGYFRPRRWYVLEPYLVAGDLFDAQRKRTKLLQKFADEAGIEYTDDHRAKLAEVGGQTCWSLYIRDNKYVVCYLDGETFEDEFIFGMVTNSRSVGGFKGIIGTDVVFDDGEFEVTLIRTPKNPLELNELLGAIVMKQINPQRMYSFKAGSVHFECGEEIPWTLDGEFGGKHREVVVKDKKQALKIMVRQEMAAGLSASGKIEEK